VIPAVSSARFNEGHLRWQESVGINAPQLAPLNLTAARALGAPTLLAWDRYVFHVDPVGFIDGFDLKALERRMEMLDDESDDPDERIAWTILLHDFEKQFRKLVRPRRRSLWLRWRWAKGFNPFRNLSPEEVGQLLSFFYVCLKMTRVGGLSPSVVRVHRT
jgi:hypothetical protein